MMEDDARGRCGNKKIGLALALSFHCREKKAGSVEDRQEHSLL